MFSQILNIYKLSRLPSEKNLKDVKVQITKTVLDEADMAILRDKARFTFARNFGPKLSLSQHHDRT